MKVSAERFVLSGYVSSDTASVTINDISCTPDEWRGTFGKVYKLEKGSNVFTIKAVDYAGNSTVRVIKVIRK